MVTLYQLVTQKAAVLGPNFWLGKNRGLFLRYSKSTGWSLVYLSCFQIFLRSCGFFSKTHLHRIYYRMRREPNVPPALLANFENLWNRNFPARRPYVPLNNQPARLPAQGVIPAAPNPNVPLNNQPVRLPAHGVMPAAPNPILPQIVIDPQPRWEFNPLPGPILGSHWCKYNRSNIWTHPEVQRLRIPVDQALEGFPELALARSFLQTPDLFLQKVSYNQQVENALVTGVVEKEAFKRGRNIAQNDQRISLADGAAHFGIRQNYLVEFRIKEPNSFDVFHNLVKSLLPIAHQNGGLLAVVLSRGSESCMIGIDLRRREEPRYYYFNSQIDRHDPYEGSYSAVGEITNSIAISLMTRHQYREVIVPEDADLNVFRGIAFAR